MKILELLRKEFRDFIELVLVPGMALFLPWPLCFRLFRLLSRAPFLYARQTALALEQAQKMGFVGDKQKWGAAFRLVQLVDHADLYLSRFRSDRWMDRHLVVSGDPWPDPLTPFLAISFHWGAGLWSLRDLNRHGFRTAFMFRKFSEGSAGYVVTKYAHWRLGEVERAGGASPIVTGPNVIERVRQTLQNGVSVAVLLDAPHTNPDNCIQAKLFGRNARFPGGVIRFAVEKQIPVFAFTLSFDQNTGRRRLAIKGPFPIQNEQELMDDLVSVLAEAVRRQPYAWHFWPYLESFLVRDQEPALSGVSQPSIKNV